MNLYNSIVKHYTYLFGKTIFSKLNRFIVTLGLHGLGIDNYQNDHISGEKYVIEKFIKQADKPIIIDVGAHYGDSAILAKSLNSSAIIHSFEPNPSTFLLLKKNSKKYNFYAYSYGLGNKNGSIILYDLLSQKNSPYASTYKSIFKSVHHSEVSKYKAKIITLDSFCSSVLNGKTIDLLKIDVEGNEYNVLLGAKKMINSGNVKLIQFEFNIMNRHSRVFFLDFQELLKDYSLYRLLPTGLLPIDADSLLHSEIFMFQNILAIHKK